MTTTDREYRDRQYSRMLLGLGTFIVVGCGIAVGAVFGPQVRLGVWIVLETALLIAAMRNRLDVTIDGTGIRLRQAMLPWQYVRGVEVLRGDAFRAALTTDAHPRDYRRVQHTRAGIRVWLDDPTDPHRAWVASIADPDAAEAALAGRVAA